MSLATASVNAHPDRIDFMNWVADQQDAADRDFIDRMERQDAAEDQRRNEAAAAPKTPRIMLNVSGRGTKWRATVSIPGHPRPVGCGTHRTEAAAWRAAEDRAADLRAAMLNVA